MAKYVRISYGSETRSVPIGNLMSTVEEEISLKIAELVAKGLVHDLPQLRPILNQDEWGTAAVYSGSHPTQLLFFFQMNEEGDWAFEKLS